MTVPFTGKSIMLDLHPWDSNMLGMAGTGLSINGYTHFLSVWSLLIFSLYHRVELNSHDNFSVVLDYNPVGIFSAFREEEVWQGFCGTQAT